MFDMPFFDKIRYALHTAGGVFKEPLLLFTAHLAETVARLDKAVIIFAVKVISIAVAIDRGRERTFVGLFLPDAVTVGLVAEFFKIIPVGTQCPTGIFLIKKGSPLNN